MSFLSDIFGGGSSSSSATSTSSSTATTDQRSVADGGSTVVGNNSTVTMTDANSINAGMQTAQAAVLGATKLATESNANAGEVAKAAIDKISVAYEKANSMALDTFSGNKTLVTVGVIVAVIVAVTAMKKKKG